MKIKDIVNSRGWRTFMGRVYGLGASVVIIGILFKLMHWPYADYFLIAGLITESVIFFLYAFEPSPNEYDWTLVYPELGGSPAGEKRERPGEVTRTSDALDRFERMIQGIDRIDPRTFESLNAAVNQLNQSAQSLAELTTIASANRQYIQSIEQAAQSINGLSSSFQDSARDIRDSFIRVTESYQNMAGNLREDFSRIGENNRGYSAEMEQLNRNTASLNRAYQDQITQLNQNLSALNATYANMLSAMKAK